MFYRYYLIFLITILLVPGAVSGADSRYRVEVLVLKHLQSDAEARQLDWLRDMSAHSLDLMQPEPEESEDEGSETDPGDTATTARQAPGEEESDQLSELTATGLDADALPEEDIPFADVVLVETMSDAMQDAWRRLRLSAPFRPEQYLSWEQGGEAPFPALRVHNTEVLMIDDPFAELRAAANGEIISSFGNPQQPFVFGDLETPELLSDGEATGDSVAISDAETDEQDEEEVPFPDPTLYYQLDGTVTLRKTRFLHIDLDLEHREALYDPLELEAALSAQNRAEDEQPEMPIPTSFLVHPLVQSRQVKTQRMEYFDGPYLGVLVYLTAVEAVEDENED
jgi:hypothetical protein